MGVTYGVLLSIITAILLHLMMAQQDAQMVCLQWNCRAIRPQEEYLRDYLSKHHVDIVCLQSLNCQYKHLPVLDGYFYPPFWGSTPDKERIGVATYVRKPISASASNFLPPDGYSTVCVSIDRVGGGSVKILNMYTPRPDLRGDWLGRQEFEDGNWLVLGDFNLHSRLWERDVPTADEYRSALFVEHLLDSPLTILNNGSPTRVPDRADHRLTAPDLSLVTPGLAGDALWEVGDDPLSSNHIPITTTLSAKAVHSGGCGSRTSYIYDKADWDRFRSILNSDPLEDHLTGDDLLWGFKQKVLKAANASIPQTSAKGGANQG